MMATIFSYIIVHVPTYLGKGGSPFFSDNVFADGTFLYQFEIRIRIKKREDLLVLPNSLFLAACAGRLETNKKITPFMNSYYTIRIKICMNWYKNHTVYEFVLYNLHNNCMNWYKNRTVYEFVLYNLYNNCTN